MHVYFYYSKNCIMGSKCFSNDLLLKWQILSKILRSLWVLDKSTHYFVCSRHKSFEKHILSDKDLYESIRACLIGPSICVEIIYLILLIRLLIAILDILTF